MGKFKKIGKASLLIFGIVAILTLAVYGFITLVKNMIGTEANSGPDTQTEAPVVSSGPLSPTPEPEDSSNLPSEPAIKYIEVSYVNDRLSIKNAANDAEYSNITGNNQLIVYVSESRCLESGYYEIQNSRFTDGYTISEEKDGILITIDINKPFNLADNSTGDTLVLDIIEQENASNISYRNDLSRTFMTLEKARLSKESDSFVKRYKETYDSSTGIYTIEIQSNLMPALKNELLIYNDGIIKSIRITNVQNKVRMDFETYGETIIYPNTRDYDAAITFIPVKENGNKLIVIDPGHGGMDGGTTSADQTIIEKDIVINMCRFLSEELSDMGFDVVNIREEDIFVGLMERTDIANLMKADAIISVHANAYDYAHVNGAITMYKTSEELAASIQDSIISLTGANNMGIQKYTNMSILNRAEMESVIVETGFLTNEEEAARLVTEEYQKIMAEAIARGVNNFYNGGN